MRHDHAVCRLLLIILIAVIVLFVVGGAVIGFVPDLLWWALIGLVIGALARPVLPGPQGMGLGATALFGVGGALLGGIIADAIGLGSVLQFLVAIAVAALLIAMLGGGGRRRVLA